VNEAITVQDQVDWLKEYFGDDLDRLKEDGKTGK